MSGVAQACAQIALLDLDWFCSPDRGFFSLLLIPLVLHPPPTQPQCDPIYSVKDGLEAILLLWDEVYLLDRY